MRRIKFMLFTIALLVFTLLPTNIFALDFTQVQIKYNISQRKVAPKYIAIHDTGNLNSYANAWCHFEYFNSGDRQSSADIFIDRYRIYFINNIDKYYTWAVGDRYYNWHHPDCQNYNSVSIEMCMNDRTPEGLDSIYKKTVETTKYLMTKYNIPSDRVLRHYDVTRKPCPQNFPMWDSLPSVNKNWIQFKNDLVIKPPNNIDTSYQEYLNGINKFVKDGIIKQPEFWRDIDKKPATDVLKSIKQLFRNYSKK